MLATLPQWLGYAAEQSPRQNGQPSEDGNKGQEELLEELLEHCTGRLLKWNYVGRTATVKETAIADGSNTREGKRSEDVYIVMGKGDRNNVAGQGGDNSPEVFCTQS